MATGDIIVQGGDYEITIDVTSKSTGTAIDLTALSGYIVVLYFVGGVVLQQYSKKTKPGFKSLDETDGINGIFVVRLQSIDTKTARIEDLFAEVKIEDADANFDNTMKHNPDTAIFVATIIESQSEQYTDLTA